MVLDRMGREPSPDPYGESPSIGLRSVNPWASSRRNCRASLLLLSIAVPDSDHARTGGEPYALLTQLAALCAQDPDALAMVDDQRSVTRTQLIAGIGSVARVVPEGDGLVAVLTERRIRSVEACLGVWWLGRGIVPLDATDPDSRLGDLVRRSGATLVLDAVGGHEAHVAGVPVVDVTEIAPTTLPPMRPPTTDHDVASLHFTSGSTGTPKGASRSCRQENAIFDSSRRHRQVSGGVAVLMPMNFVGGLRPIVQSPALGRFTVLIDPLRMPVARITEVITALEVTTMVTTPSLIRWLALASQEQRLLPTVIEVRTVGEFSHWRDVALTRSLCSENVQFQTRFGATEVVAIEGEGVSVGPGDPLGVGRLPLGPMPERFRIEYPDETSGRGELIVSEPIVDGYWDDLDLTARRFGLAPDGVRFWRTGDVASVDGNGWLHLHGRVDDMVKINGMLVEPAEIERVLGDLPGVELTVVLPRALSSGREQLVAHVQTDSSVSPGTIRKALLERLPSHLVPGVLMRHDRLPIGPRGKVDRLALRDMTVVPWTNTAIPREENATERALAELASAVLGIDNVGVDENLFLLGLDSLAAIEFIENVNRVLRVDLSPNDLIQSLTVAGVVRAADRQSAGDRKPRATSHISIFHPQGLIPAVHLICGAGGPALQYHALITGLSIDHCVIAHEQHGLHRRGVRRPHSIARAARWHARDIERLSPDGPILVIGHSYGGVVANDVARVLTSRGREVRLVLLDTSGSSERRRFDPQYFVRRRIPRPLYVFRPLWSLLRRTDSFRRPGSLRRYTAFYVAGARQTARHPLAAFEGPTLLVRAASSVEHARWPSADDTQTVVVPGEHNSIVKPPDVAPVVLHARRHFGLGDG